MTKYIDNQNATFEFQNKNLRTFIDSKTYLNGKTEKLSKNF